MESYEVDQVFPLEVDILSSGKEEGRKDSIEIQRPYEPKVVYPQWYEGRLDSESIKHQVDYYYFTKEYQKVCNLVRPLLQQDHVDGCLREAFATALICTRKCEGGVPFERELQSCLEHFPQEGEGGGFGESSTTSNPPV